MLDFVMSWAADIIAALILFAILIFYDPITNRLSNGDISTQMKRWRLEWARQMLWRSERITDVALARGLIGNVSFFATTSVFLASGLAASMSAAPTLATLIQNIAIADSTDTRVISAKLACILLLIVAAFFKFAWSMRLHSYALIMVGAAPEPQLRDSAQAQDVIGRIAELSYLASAHFTGGVRAYYLAFATLPWLVSIWLFYISLFLVILIMLRRDFYSSAHKVVARI